MLNPSTADGRKDDPTIRKCVQFAKNWECRRLIVVNLFAYRATDPKKLLRLENVDQVGAENCHYVQETLGIDLYEDNNPLIVAAWGNDGTFLDQDETMIGWLEYRDVWCLGTNKNGTPKHPLYIPYTQSLERYDGRNQAPSGVSS